jgi:N-acyl-D-amino-acid deacylase
MNALPLTHARALVGRGLVLCVVAAITAPAAERFDTLIRGARVIDGTGNPWYRADVALRGDRIVAIGNLKDDTATTVVDARERTP